MKRTLRLDSRLHGNDGRKRGMSSIPDFGVRRNSMSKRIFVFALGAIFLTLSFSVAGAAAEENPTDRFAICPASPFLIPDPTLEAFRLGSS